MYLFIGCAWPLLLLGLFSSCGEQRVFSSCGAQASYCGGFSCCRSWALRCVGFSHLGSWTLEYRLNSCGIWAELLCVACGIFLAQGWNLCVLHLQAVSLPLSHQGKLRCGPFLKSLLNLFQDWFCFMFCFFGPVTCGILSSRSGVEPAPSAALQWKVKS